MTTQKKSSIIYHDAIAVVNEMPDEMAGKFIKLLVSLMRDGTDVMGQVDASDSNSFALKIALHPFVSQLKRDNETYKKRCKNNRINGSKGGRPKKNPKNPHGFLKTQNNPKNPDNDTDNDNDTDKTLPPTQKPLPGACVKFAKNFYDFLATVGGKKNPTKKDIDNGAATIDKLVRIDGYDLDGEIKPALRWAVKDDFWASQVRSLTPLRKKAKNGDTKFNNLFGKYSVAKNKTESGLSEAGRKTAENGKRLLQRVENGETLGGMFG